MSSGTIGKHIWLGEEQQRSMLASYLDGRAHEQQKGDHHAKRYWDYCDMKMLENNLTNTKVVT